MIIQNNSIRYFNKGHNLSNLINFFTGNNSFKPQKNLIDNYKKPFAPPRTNNNVTNFKVSTEKYFTTEEFERRYRNINSRPSTLPKYKRNNENFVPLKPINVHDNESCQKSRNLQNVPRSLFVKYRGNKYNQINKEVPEKTTFKPKMESRNISVGTTGNENEAIISNVHSTKMFSVKALSFNMDLSSNVKPQEAIPIPRQYTFDSGFDERIETQFSTSASSKAPIADSSSKNINENESHSFIEDSILGQAMQIPDFLIENSTDHQEQQSIVFDSNINFPNSSSTPVDASSITDVSPINQTADNITIDHQLQFIKPDISSISHTSESSTIDNQLQLITPKSSQTQKYSYPDVYENFSISLLTENDSSVLKLSNNSISSDSPQSINARQSILKNTKIPGIYTFIAQQGKSSSKNASQLPVIALRDFSEYHDIGIDEGNEILVRVTSANFDKIYVVTKINDEKNLNEFCKSPVSSKSKLFLVNSSNEEEEIEIKKLGTKSMNHYCGKGQEGSAEILRNNSLLSSINHKKFSVQKLDKTSKSPNSKGIDIHVTKNSDKNSNFTVVKEQSTCYSYKNKTELK